MYTKHDGLSVLTIGNKVQFLATKRDPYTNQQISTTRRGVVVKNAPNIKKEHIFTIEEEPGKYRVFDDRKIAYIEKVS